MVPGTAYLERWLTDWPAMSGEPRLTRRAVLLGTLAVPLAACHSHSQREGSSSHPDVVHPDVAALGQAIADEEELLLTLNRLESLGDVRASEQGVHADHLIALRKALNGSGAPPTSSPSPTASRAARKRELAHRFDGQRAASAKRLGALSLAAASGSTAALLASISACHNAPEAFDGAQFYGGGQ